MATHDTPRFIPPLAATATGGASVPDDVALAARGDRQAFERIYRAHVGRVYALCLRMTADRGVAEELTQDAFVRAWEKLELFRGDSAFGTWLHRLAVNVVLNQRRTDVVRRARYAEGEDADPDVLSAPPVAPGERLDLDAAIARLPAGARRVFVLHDVEGYTHEEIAASLGITSGGTKAQLHRARLLLRQALQR